MTLRRAVLVVALANFAYFLVEFAVAKQIGSVSLFADCVDFFEDAAVNGLIFIALAWSRKQRSWVGMLLAASLLVPALATFWTAWNKINHPTPPEPWLLSLTGLGALTVNLFCAFLLAKFRNHEGSLPRVAFLSARNDAVANIGIILAGLITVWWRSGVPDLVVGLAIMAMNLDAAKSVWEAAKKERLSLAP
jgi:Co/Zn/Cd efflux system component